MPWSINLHITISHRCTYPMIYIQQVYVSYDMSNMCTYRMICVQYPPPHITHDMHVSSSSYDTWHGARIPWHMSNMCTLPWYVFSMFMIYVPQVYVSYDIYSMCTYPITYIPCTHTCTMSCVIWGGGYVHVMCHMRRRIHACHVSYEEEDTCMS